MAKSTSKKSSEGGGIKMPGPVGIGVVTVGAILIVGGLIMLSGGFASPTEAPPTIATSDPASDDRAMVGEPLDIDELVDCAGSPCPALGSEDAPVTYIEISEYSCSHCRDHNMDVAPQLIEEFVESGDVRLVSHLFAIAPNTMYIASASLCAQEQGKYFEFQSEAFKDDIGMSGADLSEKTEEIAERMGLDTEAFMECAEEMRYVDDVQTSSIEAQRAGIQYTPTFIVNGLIIEGGQPIEILRTKIEQALEEG